MKEIEENNAGKPKTNEQVTECLKKSKMQAMSEFGKFARLGTLQQINEHRVTLEAALQVKLFVGEKGITDKSVLLFT